MTVSTRIPCGCRVQTCKGTGATRSGETVPLQVWTAMQAIDPSGKRARRVEGASRGCTHPAGLYPIRGGNSTGLLFWKDHVLLAGEPILNPSDHNVQVLRLVHKVQVVGAQREDRTEVKAPYPFLVKRVQ